MTALIAARSVRVTGFERVLLATAAAMDRFVAARMARRESSPLQPAARLAAGDARATALALGSLGLLPR